MVLPSPFVSFGLLPTKSREKRLPYVSVSLSHLNGFKMDKVYSVFKRAYGRAKSFLFALLAVFGLASMCHAQEAAQQYDIQIVADIGSRLEATLETFWDNNATTIYVSVGLVVATALIWMVLKFFLKGTRRA